MGGRGSASSVGKWDWKNEYDLGKNVKIFDKDPIGPENKIMYKDSIKNITSVYPIIPVANIEPVTVKGALGVAVVGVEFKESENPDNIYINGFLNLGFDDKTFATQMSLTDVVTDNYDKKWSSTGLDNHIVIHESAHMLDYQLSIKKNTNMSLEEFLSPKEISKKDLLKEQRKMMDQFSKHKRFSSGFANELQKEMKQDPQTILNQISNYARTNEAEFFAEAFTKWYLSKDKDGNFEKSFEKVFKRRINNL